MAIIIASGFDWVNSVYQLAFETRSPGYASDCYAAHPGRFDGYCMQQYFPFYYGIAYNIPQQSTYVISMAININYIEVHPLLTVEDNGISQLQLMFNSSNKLDLYSNGELMFAGSKVFTNANWYWISWNIKLDPILGYSELWIDGAVDHNVSGINTAPSGNNFANFIAFGSGTSSGSGHDPFWNYDDMIISDLTGTNAPYNSAPIPDRHLYTKRPISDISVSWIPNTGTTNYTQVGEVFVDDTNYVKSKTLGNIDTYGTPTNQKRYPVDVIQSNIRANKDSWGNRTIQFQVNGILRNSNVMVSTLQEYSELDYIDPATGLPWTNETADIIPMGFKLVS
jgi:hypothetical protein